MKKGKEWLKSEIEIMGSETSENYPHEQMVDREVVLSLIDQLDEPEKVVIPKFVADWIEHCKGNDLDLYEAFGHSDMSVEVSDFIGDMDADEFARAWLDYPNIEVEKEKLYYVRLPTNLEDDIIILDEDGDIWADSWPSRYKMTEKRIKEIDERYWPFAVEVAE